MALVDRPYKYNQCHTTLGGLSRSMPNCNQLAPKITEILEINVLQKFTFHALSYTGIQLIYLQLTLLVLVGAELPLYVCGGLRHKSTR